MLVKTRLTKGQKHRVFPWTHFSDSHAVKASNWKTGGKGGPCTNDSGLWRRQRLIHHEFDVHQLKANHWNPFYIHLSQQSKEKLYQREGMYQTESCPSNLQSASTASGYKPVQRVIPKVSMSTSGWQILKISGCTCPTQAGSERTVTGTLLCLCGLPVHSTLQAGSPQVVK